MDRFLMMPEEHVLPDGVVAGFVAAFKVVRVDTGRKACTLACSTVF